MEWLITLGAGLAMIVGIIGAVFLTACIHAFCTGCDVSPWWMRAIGGVSLLIIVALIMGAMVRFS